MEHKSNSNVVRYVSECTELWMCECGSWLLSIGHEECLACQECRAPMIMKRRKDYKSSEDTLIYSDEMGGLLARLAGQMRETLPAYLPDDLPPLWELYEKLMYVFYTSRHADCSFRIKER